jgi:hypothetical protein
MIVLAVVEREEPLGAVRRRVDRPLDIVTHGIVDRRRANLKSHRVAPMCWA